MGGGLRPPILLEVTGPPGSGKTQLCHQLAVMVQLPPERGGLSARCLYIDTEGTFRPERVVSIARYRGIDPDAALKGVEVIEARSVEDAAWALVRWRGLLVVDSLPPLVGGLERPLSRLAAFLGKVLELSIRLGQPCVVTNRWRGGRCYGDPYVCAFTTHRLVLKPHGGIIVAELVYPRAMQGAARLRICEEGVLDAEE